jgi:hypothetical protein
MILRDPQLWLRFGEVHCHSRRTDAHGSYARRRYEESPKYFVKKL